LLHLAEPILEQISRKLLRKLARIRAFARQQNISLCSRLLKKLNYLYIKTE
jgi:hypothetical protein